jgi:hypothetical protein
LEHLSSQTTASLNWTLTRLKLSRLAVAWSRSLSRSKSDRKDPCNSFNLSLFSSQSRFSRLLLPWNNLNGLVTYKMLRRCLDRESKKQIKKYLIISSKANKTKLSPLTNPLWEARTWWSPVASTLIIMLVKTTSRPVTRIYRLGPI